jgi:AcrR family transcriptional regulator
VSSQTITDKDSAPLANQPRQRGRGHREALLEGAIKCIQDKGYARTTARDLVAISGTNLASIGYHFGSKEKLLNEAIAEAFRRWVAHLGAVALEHADAAPIDCLRLSLGAWSDTFEENRPFVVAFVEALAQSAHSEELRDQLAQQYRESRGLVTELVDECIPAGTEVPAGVNSATVASILIGLVDGLMLQWLLEPETHVSGEELLRNIEGAMRVVGN